MTNYEKIKNMTIDEMAEEITEFIASAFIACNFPLKEKGEEAFKNGVILALLEESEAV